MLRELRIRDLGVISEAVVEFSSGLTALTGETGAGKTLIVAGLGLLLGERADLGVIRAGCERALVEGWWDLPDDLLETIRDLGGDAQGELLTTRQIGGRSRALVDGAQTTVNALAELVGKWATIHGQSGQIQLADANRQRELLDAYALPACLPAYREDYEELSRCEAELRHLIDEAERRDAEAELLAFGLTEIDQVAPNPGEDAQLLAESTRLQAAEELAALAQAAQTALSGGDDPISEPGMIGLAAHARRALEQASRHDPVATELHERLAELGYLISDIASDVSRYLADQVPDPARLATTMDRRAELAKLTRKYGADIEQVLEWAENARIRLAELESSNARIETVRAQIVGLRESLERSAAQITAARRRGADELAGLVDAELRALAMPHAQLRFSLTPLNQLGPHGAERVELMFTANPGSTPAQLAKVASGGELSRVRLALEVVLADANQGQTLVFDEVDAGVGGAVGLEIGRRLQRLADRCQVVVVTHLAQVAAFADQHLVVTKSSSGDVTTSGVVSLAPDQRATELARMMAGLGHSDAGLKHAEDLLAEARRPARPPGRS